MGGGAVAPTKTNDKQNLIIAGLSYGREIRFFRSEGKIHTSVDALENITATLGLREKH